MNDVQFSNDLVMEIRKMEKTLVKHPAVEDVVVISFHTPDGEQKIKAFVEPGTPPPSAESIIEYCQRECGNATLPIEIVFREIPRTASGKVIRQQLLHS
jgi:acyl-coenzyme A synthetase/AMP-(fatty) acid ligase